MRCVRATALTIIDVLCDLLIALVYDGVQQGHPVVLVIRMHDAWAAGARRGASNAAGCSEAAQGADAHPPLGSGSLGAQDPPPGPRDRTISAFFEFSFFKFCFNYAAQMLD
jgi:hypothetical protein